MPERKEMQIKAVEDARRHFMEGAIAFAATQPCDLTAVLDNRRNVRISFLYNPASRLGLPLEVIDFADSVYGRQVEIRSITALWSYTRTLKDGDTGRHINVLDITVGLPSGSSGVTDDGGILVQRQECFVAPTFTINLDSTPFSCLVLAKSVAGCLKEDGSLPEPVTTILRKPQIVALIGDIFAGAQENKGRSRLGLRRFLPTGSRNLKDRIRDSLMAAVYPGLYGEIPPPQRKIEISDPTKAGHFII